MDAELCFHVEAYAEDLVRSGVARTEALRRAQLEFGRIDRTKEECREARGVQFLEPLTQDVRFGLRMVRKSPGFAAVAVLTLAIGIGANTTIFSVINAVLFNLPYPHPDRLVALDMAKPNQVQQEFGVSLPDLQDWQQRNNVFEAMDGILFTTVTLRGAGTPQALNSSGFTSEDFRILGVAPELGRTFNPEEDGPEGAHVAILSDALWRQNFGANPQILGKSIQLDDSLYTVVGVMPAAFKYPTTADLWIPFHSGSETRATLPFLPNRRARLLAVIARLKPGETLKHAQQQMDALARIIEHEHPEANQGFDVRLTPIRQKIVGLSFEKTLLLLFGAVGFVLLIACANMANLSLARVSGRQKELAIRFALGGSRNRLLRQLLTESTLISVLGAGAALLFAIWTTNILLRFLSTPENQLPATVSLDGRVLMFTVLVSLATCVGFGLLPALRVSKTNASEGIVTASAKDRRVQGFLVVTEIALSLVLLVGSGLLIKSFARLLQVDLGFNPSHVLAMEIYPSLYRYPADKMEKRNSLLNEVVHRL